MELEGRKVSCLKVAGLDHGYKQDKQFTVQIRGSYETTKIII